MFTGLVEEIGIINRINKEGNGYRLEIMAKKVLEGVKVDDSIAVNGTCLTVTAFSQNSFTVQAISETVSKTTLKNLTVGAKVNLERALQLSSRLGGHLVQGHIDAIAEIVSLSIADLKTDYLLKAPASAMKYVVSKGSVCLDGISLTVAEVTNESFRVSIIPHTIKSTIISQWRSGTQINLETDIIGRYIEKLLTHNQPQSSLTLDRLQELGY